MPAVQVDTHVGTHVDPAVHTAPVKAGSTYPALDGMRALAVFLVVMTHIGFQTGDTFRGGIGPLLARGDFGVTIFFLLSGFLLYSPFARAGLLGRPAPSIRGYLRNRGLRILPGYWAAVLVVLPVMATDHLHPRELADQLLLLEIYTRNHLLAGLTQMWSLCVEASFYLLLPLLAWLAARGRRPLLAQSLLLGAMVVGSLLWTVSTRGFGHPDPSVGGLWLPAYLDWFALGMGVAVLRAWHDVSGRLRVLDDVGDAAGACWVGAAAIVWLTSTPLGGPLGIELATLGQALTKHLLYGAAALLLLLPAVFGRDERSRVRRALEHPLSRWLGSISYGVFLWHLLVLWLVLQLPGLSEFGGHLPLVTLLVVPLSVLVAWVSLRVVEQPALDLKRRWTTAGR